MITTTSIYLFPIIRNMSMFPFVSTSLPSLIPLNSLNFFPPFLSKQHKFNYNIPSVSSKNRTQFSSSSSSSSSSSPLPPLHPSCCYIILPQLSPRMQYGRVSQWLVKEGDALKYHQVFMEIETSELTDEKKKQILVIESHENGILHKILPSGSINNNNNTNNNNNNNSFLSVGTPIAIYKDNEWVEGEKARGEFLWQAYVKQEDARSGCCAPDRESSGSANNISTPTKKKKSNKKKL